MKFVMSVIATCLFLILLIIIHYVHVTQYEVNVVFYAAIFNAFLAAVLTAGVIFLPLFKVISVFEKFLLIVIWLLLGYSLAISLPTVIDRSLSFYILEKLHQRGGGIQQEAFLEIFTTEYVNEHRLVDVRLTEQLESGTINIVDGCVILTKKGQRIVNFSLSYRANWLPKKRLLMGEYTDQLTRPFEGNLVEVDYKCN